MSEQSMENNGEIIDITGSSSASRLLFHTVQSQMARDGFRNSFEVKGPEINVKLYINGIQVPVGRALGDVYQCLQNETALQGNAFLRTLFQKTSSSPLMAAVKEDLDDTLELPGFILRRPTTSESSFNGTQHLDNTDEIPAGLVRDAVKEERTLQYIQNLLWLLKTARKYVPETEANLIKFIDAALEREVGTEAAVTEGIAA